jgi:hypothetical protein
MKKILLGLALLLAIASTACAGGFANTTSLALGANGIWSDGETEPLSDFEACVNGAMSLSPHISVVGMIGTGLTEAYVRSTVGVRFTATDVDYKSFSASAGIQYHNGSTTEQGPAEWCPEAAIGLVPLPKQAPDLLLTAVGWYGLDSQRAGCAAGIRWAFHL